jgi:uncharacterized membrane protein YfbV (UPF0208 family)
MEHADSLAKDAQDERIARAFVRAVIVTCAAFALAVTPSLCAATCYWAGAQWEAIAPLIFPMSAGLAMLFAKAGYVVFGSYSLWRIARQAPVWAAQIRRYLDVVSSPE